MANRGKAKRRKMMNKKRGLEPGDRLYPFPTLPCRHLRTCVGAGQDQVRQNGPFSELVPKMPFTCCELEDKEGTRKGSAVGRCYGFTAGYSLHKRAAWKSLQSETCNLKSPLRPSALSAGDTAAQPSPLGVGGAHCGFAGLFNYPNHL